MSPLNYVLGGYVLGANVTVSGGETNVVNNEKQLQPLTPFSSSQLIA